ncbi:30S ribosomal protein S2 [Patescibacteria group bacterium]|nr:30S ribosomal protein S2 [Patescibacteria group bacterium]
MAIKTIKTPTVEELFEAGGHLGHRKDKTDATMHPYIFRIQNRISIINLDKTVVNLSEALEYISDLASHGKTILFVGTKNPEVAKIIKKAAVETKSPYMVERWIGGLLTNFKNVKKKIDHIKKLEIGREKKEFEGYTKKERMEIDKKIEEGLRIFGGIKEMVNLPEAMIVFDTHNEIIAVKEAAKLNIGVIGINDMKYSKKLINKFIPINDESRKATKLLAETFIAAIKEAKKEK